MDKTRKKQIITFLNRWVDEEGLCRFCDTGRCCEWSRAGRGTCREYEFSHEMDCFHLWIGFFDRGEYFRDGYDSPPNSYLFKEKKFPWSEEIIDEKEVSFEILKEKKLQIMDKFDQLNKELEVIDKQLGELSG